MAERGAAASGAAADLPGGAGDGDAGARGRIADGAVLWLCAPAYVREHAVPAIRRGRERAGKALDGFEIVVSVPAAVTADRLAGGEVFKAELVRYLALPFYCAMLEKSGFGSEISAWSARRVRRPSATASCRPWAPSATPRRSRASWRPTVKPASRCRPFGPSGIRRAALPPHAGGLRRSLTSLC